MKIIASTGPGGKKVAPNMGILAQNLTDSATEMYVEDTSFLTINEYYWIEEEVVKVTAIGTPCTIARAQPNKPGGSNTSADEHDAGVDVRLRDVTEILSYSFSGSEDFEQIRISGNYMFIWGLDIDGDVDYFEDCGEPNMGLAVAIVPFTRRETPAKTVKLLIWTKYTRMFKAFFEG